ncbi:MAG: hypothetical protein LBJ67_07640 [Planctomycetaceae bacterium]|nr:hypothetical protein [Planctomycetaceae bacterium]
MEFVDTGCGVVSVGKAKLLGKTVQCKCGRRFIFLWWFPVIESIHGLSPKLAKEC